GAEAGKGRGCHVGLHANRHGHAAAMDLPERLGNGEAVGVVEAKPAEGFRLGDAEKSCCAELFEEIMRWEFPRRFPFIDVRVDLLVDEFCEGADQLLMLGPVYHSFLLA